jgi:hypothetical protein
MSRVRTSRGKIAFVADVQAQLADVSSFTSPELDDDVSSSLKRYLTCLPLKPSTLSARSRHLLDLSGTALWNTCVRLERVLSQGEGEESSVDFLVQGISPYSCIELGEIISSTLVQALAFLMLDSCVLREYGRTGKSSLLLKLVVVIDDLSL